MMNRRAAVAGKVVIVTGASSGIGESTALEFARAGAITVLAARRKDRLKQLERKIEEMGGTALAVPTDLTALDQITNLVQTVLATFGRIDVLANIAGWGFYDWFQELSAEELRQHYEVNVIGLAEHAVRRIELQRERPTRGRHVSSKRVRDNQLVAAAWRWLRYPIDAVRPLRLHPN